MIPIAGDTPNERPPLGRLPKLGYPVPKDGPHTKRNVFGKLSARSFQRPLDVEWWRCETRSLGGGVVPCFTYATGGGIEVQLTIVSHRSRRGKGDDRMLPEARAWTARIVGGARNERAA